MCFDKWGRTTLYGGEYIALKMKKSPPVLGEGIPVRFITIHSPPYREGQGVGLLVYPMMASTV